MSAQAKPELKIAKPSLKVEKKRREMAELLSRFSEFSQVELDSCEAYEIADCIKIIDENPGTTAATAARKDLSEHRRKWSSTTNTVIKVSFAPNAQE